MIVNPDGSFEMAVLERSPAEKAALAASLGKSRPPPGFGALTRDVLTAQWELPSNDSPEAAYARSVGVHPPGGAEAIELAERRGGSQVGRAGPSRVAGGAEQRDLAYTAVMASMAPGRLVIWRPNASLSEHLGPPDARVPVGSGSARPPGAPHDDPPVGRTSALSRLSGPQPMVPLLEVDVPVFYGASNSLPSDRAEQGWFGRFRARSQK